MPVSSGALALSTTPGLSMAALSEFQPSGAVDVDRSSPLSVSAGNSVPVSSDSARLSRHVVELWLKLIAEPVDTSVHQESLEASLFPAVIDTAAFAIEGPEKERLEAALKATFEAEPLEDGIDHPAEQIIGQALQSVETFHILACLEALSVDAEHPGFSASVLRCLSRLRPGTSAWRAGVVRTALGVDDVEMRDAALQAAESWGGADIRDVLLGHVEAVPWLRAYIQDVVDDLRA